MEQPAVEAIRPVSLKSYRAACAHTGLLANAQNRNFPVVRAFFASFQPATQPRRKHRIRSLPVSSELTSPHRLCLLRTIMSGGYAAKKSSGRPASYTLVGRDLFIGAPRANSIPEKVSVPTNRSYVFIIAIGWFRLSSISRGDVFSGTVTPHTKQLPSATCHWLTLSFLKIIEPTLNLNNLTGQVIRLWSPGLLIKHRK